MAFRSALFWGAASCADVGQDHVSCVVTLEPNRFMNGATDCLPSWAEADEVSETEWHFSAESPFSIRDRSADSPWIGWLIHRNIGSNIAPYLYELTCVKPLSEFPNACSSGVGVTQPGRHQVFHRFKIYIAFYAFRKDTGKGPAKAVLEARVVTDVVPGAKDAAKRPICSGTYKLLKGSCLGFGVNGTDGGAEAQPPPEPPEYFDSHEWATVKFPKLDARGHEIHMITTTEAQRPATSRQENPATTTQEESANTISSSSFVLEALAVGWMLTIAVLAYCVRRSRNIEEARRQEAQVAEIHRI